jgi:hypothetical protein
LTIRRRVVENDGGGVDLVRSSASVLVLTPGVENLTLIGNANIDATGNMLANIIIGNAGNNQAGRRAGT